jgi:glycosyltransferase involved in cell wall biosynthesis
MSKRRSHKERGRPSPFIDNRPTLSVVVPAYNEEGNILPLYEGLCAVLNGAAECWELLLVDDGSTDQTWKMICTIHARDRRLRGLRLSRNFGHQYALFAGMKHARGRAVVSMDADLQHPPETILELLERWRQGYRVVNTVRQDAETTSWPKRWSSRLYYAVFSYMSGVRLQNGMADFRLLDRCVVDELINPPYSPSDANSAPLSA